MSISLSVSFPYQPLIAILLGLSSCVPLVFGCPISIFSFGDSLADTGNLLLQSPIDARPRFLFPPYGETYFRRPTGRCSDGRLVVDFIAEALSLPFLPPYLAVKNESGGRNFRQGVNFAVGGATVLDNGFFEERGIHNPFTNISLGDQLDWFKELLPSLCLTSSDCKELLGNSLVLMGEIGGNDYNHPFFIRRSLEEIKSFVPLVINAIASAINELIMLGAKTIVVPGNLPIGCSTIFLTYYRTTNTEEYDPKTGCLTWLNEFSEYHNKELQLELHRIRELHPDANIIYADYYNAAMSFFHSPAEFGFKGSALAACCGGGGPYNYNASALCGTPLASVCDDPSLYVNWDGVHLTEAAYKWISTALLQGPFTNPQIDFSCASVAMNFAGRSKY